VTVWLVWGCRAAPQVGWDYGLLSGFVTTAVVTGILMVQFVMYAGNKVKDPKAAAAAAAAGAGADKNKQKETKKTK
jgi:hypothetical protein